MHKQIPVACSESHACQLSDRSRLEKVSFISVSFIRFKTEYVY